MYHRVIFDAMLTLENLQEVADLIEKVLSNKHYTWVSCNEFFGFKPEVRTSQCLDKHSAAAVQTWFEEDYGGFNVNDSYGVWGATTTLKDKSAYDHEFNNPYIVISDDQIEITQRAPAGHLLYWTITVERDN